MRTVTGRTDHVVVVGAGLSGLAAALHLAGRGRTVTVCERAPVPGGRAGRLDVGGYRLDTGPSVLTMPDIVEDTLAAVGDTLETRLDLVPVIPAYRACFADGSSLEVHCEAEAMAQEITTFAGPGEAAGYRRLREWLDRLYRVEFDRFIGANFDSPAGLLVPRLAQLIALGGFRRWDAAVSRFLGDERLRRVFTFQSLYAGVAPRRALALYAVIAYMDTVAGVYFPRGGMRALPDALAAAATDAGVRFRYNTTVTTLQQRDSRVHAVQLSDGDRIACDAVVLATELSTAYRLLNRTPRRVVPLRAAPSAVVLHGACATTRPAAHHTLLFGAAWERTFSEIIDAGVPMSDPSLLVSRPTVNDPRLAPPGRDLLYVLAPVPNLDRGRIDWPRRIGAYTDDLISTVRRRLPEIGDIDILHTSTPTEWADQNLLAGTPFSLAHTFAQTGPFRPSNLPAGTDNVVLAGCGTVPGVGVPTALISGRLAADRITGSIDRLRRRSISSTGVPR